MGTKQVHRTTSVDGTEIAGRVYGAGPPVVLVHGALADGESEWEALIPHLADRHRCYVMSTRGRGDSSDHPDHSPDRIVADVAMFADSIGETVRMVGVSGGGRHALGAVARGPGDVDRLAVHEPAVFETMSDDVSARFWEIVDEMDHLSAQGKDPEAAQTFFEYAANDEELDALGDGEVLAAAARYVPVDLADFRGIRTAEGAGPTSPSVLEQIRVPVLVTHGDRTALPDVPDSVDYVARHVTQAEVREIEGTGHLAHATHPEAVAEELRRFLDD